MRKPVEKDPSGREAHVPERKVSGRIEKQATRPSTFRTAFERIQEFAGHMKLRSKLLLSLVLVIATMTGGTLLTVRQSMQAQAQRQVEEDARNSILTFQVMEQQRRLVLGRKAELLATLAYMRNGDPTVIRDVSQDPWQSEECDLFALVDSKGKVTALQSRISDFPANVSSKSFKNLVREAGSQDWWVNGKQVYRVVVKRFFKDPPINSVPMGAVIVGREIDPARAKDLGRILASEVVFQSGADLTVSSLGAVDEQQLAGLIKSGSKLEPQLGKRHFYTSSLELLPGAHPNLTFVVLKSDEDALASVGRLNHWLVGLGLIVILAGVLLVYVISDTFTKPLGSLVEGVRTERLRKRIRNHVNQQHARQDYDQSQADEPMVQPPDRRQRIFIRLQHNKSQIRMRARQQLERTRIEMSLSELRLQFAPALDQPGQLLFVDCPQRTHRKVGAGLKDHLARQNPA